MLIYHLKISLSYLFCITSIIMIFGAMSPKEFLEKYVALCKESGFCLVSYDPYETVVVSRLDPSSPYMDKALDDSWIDSTLSFYYE